MFVRLSTSKTAPLSDSGSVIAELQEIRDFTVVYKYVTVCSHLYIDGLQAGWGFSSQSLKPEPILSNCSVAPCW